MATNESIKIKKLQRNLSSLRKLAGWTAEALGQKIGVTKQTISNLETERTAMSKIQYIAIRTVLDYEAKTNPNLARALSLVLDDQDSSEGEHKANEDKVRAVAAASSAGVNSAILGTILGVASIALGAWLAEIMDNDF